MPFKLENFKFKYIIILGLVLRALLFRGPDLSNEDYYEYGHIANHIVDGHGYSLFCFKVDKPEVKNEDGWVWQKSAYMPPLYVFFLVPFMMIKNIALRNSLLLLIQLLASLFVIRLIYDYSLTLFNRKIAIIAGFLAAILPDFMYSFKSYTPFVFYQILILLFLIKLNSWINEGLNFKRVLFLGVISALIISCRSEFYLFLFLIAVYLAVKTKAKYAVGLIALVLLLQSPWMIRNYYVFNKFIPTTTNGGFNLFRGNNNISVGEWGKKEIDDDIMKNLRDDNYELIHDQRYKEEALKYISGNPVASIKMGFEKISDLWIVNIHYFTPNDKIIKAFGIIVFAFFVIGVYTSRGKSMFYIEYIYFLYSSIIAFFFFVLPRYQTMLRTVMIPFCAYGLYCLYVAKQNYFRLKKQ